VLRAVLLLALLPATLLGQDLSGRRLGPLTVSGEASGSLSPEDRGFYNDTGYDTHPLRQLWLGVDASLRLGSRAALLLELVSEDLDAPRLRAAYLRLSPARAIDVQLGRVPPVFGAFGRRAYSSANPLIGLPLGYQYLNTTRSDSLPRTADDLLRVRGHGWLVRHPIGDRSFAPGQPIVDVRDWDTGVELRLGREPLALAVAVTQGALCDPRLSDDNDGKQLSARLAFSPRPGLALGVSLARGAYADRSLLALLPADQRDLHQRALGADLEWGRGPWTLRAEAIGTEWDVPELPPAPTGGPLRALTVSVEGTRKLGPRVHLAARFDRLGFSSLAGTQRTTGWDAPVTRLEGGGGFRPWRPLTLKATYQYNWREEGPAGRHGLVAVQAAVRF
jgi:hypothetical protein